MIGKTFRVWPKKTIRRSGLVIVPDMVVIVTTQYYAPTPFYRGIDEVREVFQNIYRVDIKKMGCCSGDFNYTVLG
ncbi:MAG: hypothetical protein IKX67_10230 [Bacteroidales bacterium]|nr:hypothetical protein [Bacteroidales bacterium]